MTIANILSRPYELTVYYCNSLTRRILAPFVSYVQYFLVTPWSLSLRPHNRHRHRRHINYFIILIIISFCFQ